MASHEVAPPAAGGSGLKITFKRTLPNPAPAPSTSAVPPPAASDHSARTSASIPAQSARSASRETSQKVKIKKPSSTADSAAHGELRSKYDALKAKYKNLEESRDEASLSLLRAQKLITHLRDEKAALLDRILALESDAGITSTETLAAQDTSNLSEQQRDNPLLFPPPLPSTADRIRPTPTLYTNTDLSTPSYNDPAGPAPLPDSLPPSKRSHHLNAVVAAEQAQAERNGERTAPGPPPVTARSASASSPMNGVEATPEVAAELPSKRKRTSYQQEEPEEYVAPVPAPVATVPEPYVPAPEARPPSSSKGLSIKLTSKRSTKAKTAELPVEPVAAVLNALPNPFGGFAPSPAPIAPTPANSYASNLAALPPLPLPIPHYRQYDTVMDDAASPDYDDYDAAADDSSAYGSVPPPSSKKKSATPTAPTSAAGDRPVKPKRPKNAAVVSGTHLVPFIPKNPDGSPKLPLPVSTMLLRNLGVVDTRPGYHTDRYIYPIGFDCMRRYPSMIDPRETVEYYSRIVDGGDSPRFVIEAQDQPGVIIAGNTATAPWSQIVRAANKIRQRNHSNSVSGPDSYGLSQLPIKKLIQELPGVDRLDRYVWQNYIEEADPTIALEEARLQRLAIRKSQSQKKRREPEVPAEYYNGGYQHNAPPSNQAPQYPAQYPPQYPPRPPSPKNPYALPFAPTPAPIGSLDQSALPPLVDPYAPIYNPYAIAALPPLAAPALPPLPSYDPSFAPPNPFGPGAIAVEGAIDPAFGQPFVGTELPPIEGARSTDLYPGFGNSASPFEHGGME